MSDLLRIYAPEECGPDGYPTAWHHDSWENRLKRHPPIKWFVRNEDGYRCIRCGHPYPPGVAQTHPRGEWTPCDEHCTHVGPWRTAAPDGIISTRVPRSVEEANDMIEESWGVWAQWRILTVHHLNGVKYDCRWWNLASLCQRCHLYIQGKVVLDREFVREHSEWFKSYAAAWYAVKYLNEELTREETTARLDELLALEQTQRRLPGLK